MKVSRVVLSLGFICFWEKLGILFIGWLDKCIRCNVVRVMMIGFGLDNCKIIEERYRKFCVIGGF